jgi:N-acetyl-anhydromuramyl-L-alanine amidase AmpD
VRVVVGMLALLQVFWRDLRSAQPAEPAEPPPVGAAGDAKIVDTPIRYDDERIALTVAYRKAHQDPDAADQKITPRAIVIHYTGGHSRKGSFAYFDRLRIEAGRKRQAAAGEVNVSAHFLVDRDGTIYRLVPEDWMARHCIGLNHVAIGIENVGDGDKYPLTDAQLAADAALVRYLVARHPGITHLLGHHEYRRMEGHEYWLERDPAYRNQKPDPGPDFMKRLRKSVADLKLAAPPNPEARKEKPSK